MFWELTIMFGLSFFVSMLVVAGITELFRVLRREIQARAFKREITAWYHKNGNPREEYQIPDFCDKEDTQ